MATKLKSLGEQLDELDQGAAPSGPGSRPTGGAAKASPAKPSIPSADNLRIWNALGKTDPEHTKGFKRAGGFQGTAIKPIWVERRLTELFGPCGIGWGIDEPSFRLVEAGDELLVYCTVAGWYVENGNRATIYGVGGDKVLSKNKYGLNTDDEAFKKACTDATGNAFKHVGVGADVHMGLFEDSKYLAEVTAEFHPPANLPEDKGRGEGEMSSSALRASLRLLVHHINGCASVADLEDILDTEDAKEVIDNCKRRFPAWWETGENMPAEFVPLKKLIDQTRRGLKELENAQ
jgi:hypothetical protein